MDPAKASMESDIHNTEYRISAASNPPDSSPVGMGSLQELNKEVVEAAQYSMTKRVSLLVSESNENQIDDTGELTSICDDVLMQLNSQRRRSSSSTKSVTISLPGLTSQTTPNIGKVQKDAEANAARILCPCPVCPLSKDSDTEMVSSESGEGTSRIHKHSSEKLREKKKEKSVSQTSMSSGSTSSTTESTRNALNKEELYGSTLGNLRLKRLEKFGGEGDSFRIVDYQNELSYPMSPSTQREGDFEEDYMKFFIEPYDVCVHSLSSLSTSYISCDEPELQRTIVIVKPDAVQYRCAILRIIFESGFQILGSRVLHLTPEQTSEIYSKYYGSPSFAHLVMTVSADPVLVISIAGMNVVDKWKKLIGPDGSLRHEWFYPLSMRKLYGLIETRPDKIHGSENFRDAWRENRYFFADSILEPIPIQEDKVWDYCNLNVNTTVTKGCVEVVKRRPVDPILFLADWLLMWNPFQPRMPKLITMAPT